MSEFIAECLELISGSVDSPSLQFCFSKKKDEDKYFQATIL